MDRIGAVRDGPDAHDFRGAGAFRRQGTTIPITEIGAIERSARPLADEILKVASIGITGLCVPKI